MRNRIAEFGLLLFLICCIVGAACALGEASGLLDVWKAEVEARRAAAHAQEYDARAGLVVAEGNAAILREAARAVANDRRLVTMYALSGNVAFLGCVFGIGAVIGALAIRYGRRERANRYDKPGY